MSIKPNSLKDQIKSLHAVFPEHASVHSREVCEAIKRIEELARDCLPTTSCKPEDKQKIRKAIKMITDPSIFDKVCQLFFKCFHLLTTERSQIEQILNRLDDNQKQLDAEDKAFF